MDAFDGKRSAARGPFPDFLSILPGMPRVIRLALGLGLVLFQARAFSLSRIWSADLARPADLLPMGRPLPEDTSMIPYPEGDWKAVYAGSLTWTGWLRSEGASSYSDVASGQAAQALWVRPMPQLDLGLTWFERMERNRYVDSGHIEARMGETRRGLGLTVVEHVLPGASGRPYLDAGVAVPDAARQGYAWMLAAGRRDAWHAEYSLAQGDVAEDFFVLNLDPGGDHETVQGLYRVRTKAHRILIKAPLGGGRLSALGAYGESEPWRPEGEFWFSDSSQRVDGNLAFSHPFALGQWRALTGYRESEATTFGRRIPPGSDGLKRFHYARNHAQSWEAGGERLPAEGETGGLRLGLAYRDYAWKSTPSADALDARDETLSYNRLGLSFIANLYGGLYKAAEIIGGTFEAGAWVADLEWRGRAETRMGGLEAVAGLTGFRTGFRLDVAGNTLSQKFLTVDTSAAYGPHIRGYLAGVTPELRLKWSWRRLGLEAGAAQIVPVAVSIEQPGKKPPLHPGAATSYPLFHNGFTAHLSLEAGY